MKKILFLFLLTACSSPNKNYNTNNEFLDFNNTLNFKEFNELLIKYNKISQYPNIDK